jgi:choline kinase
LLNSDLLFSSATVAPFFAEDHDRGGEIDIVVDFDKELRDEAMKVSCQMSDVAHVTGIGKTEVRHPLGEDIGMWRLSPTGWRRLRAALQQFVGATGCEQLWYQNALASVIDEDLCAGRASIVRATPTGESAWIEIDDRRDLQLAERLAMKEFFPGSRASSNNAEALG